MIRERFYLITIGVLLVILLVVCVMSNRNYLGLMQVNESISTELEEVKEQKNEKIADLEKRLEDLSVEYEDLELRKEELELEYEVLFDEYEVLLLMLSNKEEFYVGKYNFTEREIMLLARCVQAEAGTYSLESDKSQQYITQVILNRLGSEYFPNTIEEVIYQKRGKVPQFSVAYNGLMDSITKVEFRTLVNVYKVLLRGTDLPNYVEYFFTTSVKK